MPNEQEMPMSQARWDLGLVVVLAWPLILLAINGSWAYGDPFAGFIDPWIYTGYMLDFPAHQRIFPNIYYGSRLSWLLPGYVVFKLLPPLAANFLLRLVLVWGATGSLYLILRDTVGRRGALFATLLLGAHAYFLLAIGWDYPDGPGLAYFLTSLLLLTCAAQRRAWALSLTGAGLLAAGAVHTNLFWAAFVPFQAVYYAVVNRQGRRNSLWLSAALFTVGALGGTGMLSVAGKALGCRFLFFMPQVKHVLESEAQPNPWKLTVGEWAGHAGWLVLPAVTAAGALVLLAARRRGRLPACPTMAWVFQLYFLAAVAYLLYWETRGHPVLQFRFYASYLIPPMFLALGGQAATLLAGVPSARLRPVALAAAGACLLAAVVPLPLAPTSWPALFVLLPLALGVAGVGLWVARPSSPAWLLVVAACVGLGNRLPADVDDLQQRETSVRRDGYLAVVDGARVVQKWVQDPHFYFWYDAFESADALGHRELGGLFRAVASTYLWCYKLANENFPHLHSLPITHPERPPKPFTRRWLESLGYVSMDIYPSLDPQPNSRLIILTSRPGALEEAARALQSRGFEACLLAREEVRRGVVAFQMLLVEPKPLPAR